MKIIWVGPEEGLRYESIKAGSHTLETQALDVALKSNAADLILLHHNEFHPAMSALKYEPEIVRKVGYVDGFYRENQNWVPWCSYGTVFQHLFAKYTSFIDTQKSCLVIGQICEAHSVALELFRMGLRNFQILREDDQEQSWYEQKTKVFFGMQTEVISPRNLVHLSGESCVVVYGVRESSEVQYESELSYLNFLSRPGVVVDFNAKSFFAKVLADTQEQELTQITANDIESLSLELWLKKSQSLV